MSPELRHHSILALIFVAVVAFVATARNGYGQAWVPPRGAGSVSVTYQTIDNTGHIRTDGSLVRVGLSTNLGLYAEGEYAFTDRVSVSIGAPYVFAKYLGPPPPALPFGFKLPAVDQCHCWHGGWQDFDFTARYNVDGSAFALTPSVSVVVPSRNYNYRGEAVVGRDLREVRVAVDAGQRLDRISSKLSVQGHYSYAFVERVINIPNNRSNANAEGAFLLTRKLSARGMLLWQRTHGGLRFGSPATFPGEVNTPELWLQHDRLLRDNYWHTGGGASYSFSRMDVFASYIAFVGGTDTHAGRALTLGISWPFQLGESRSH